MKRSVTTSCMIFFFMLCGTLQSVTAQTAKDIFHSSETPITYLGIDFTNAKLIGDAGADAIEIRNRYFASINDVVINEPKKYDLQKALEKSNISSDLSFVMAKNGKVDADQIKSSSSADANRFTKSTIENIVKGYNFDGKKGVGLMFIMESLDKTAKQGNMYVTFIDMASRKVLFTERMSGDAGGFGFRNYWVKPVSDVIEQIQKRKYKEWRNAS
jgi:hypothetical protein